MDMKKTLWLALVEHEFAPGARTYLHYQEGEPTDAEITARAAADNGGNEKELEVVGLFSISYAIQADKASREALLAAIGDIGFLGNAAEVAASEQGNQANQVKQLLDSLIGLQRQVHAHYKMDVKKHYSLMVADAEANKVIANAKAAMEAEEKDLGKPIAA